MATPTPKDALGLLRAYRARRDRESLERLFRACYPLVLRIVELRLRLRVRGDREAEDFVQEALLQVLRELHRFAPRTEGEFRNWLATIVENDLRDHQRHRRAAKRRARVVRFSELQGTSLIERLIDGRPAPGEAFGASELEVRIERAMQALDEPYREALILRKLCGLSHAEIAAQMGYASPSSARSLCTRALEKLRLHLGHPVAGARRRARSSARRKA